MSFRTNRRSERYVAAICAVLVVLSLAIGPMAALAAGTNTSAVDDGAKSLELSESAEFIEPYETGLDPELENATGEVTVLVQFEETEISLNRSDESVTQRENTANASQVPLEDYAGETDGVEFDRGFWITNAAVVTVDADRVAPDELTKIDGVVGVSLENEMIIHASATPESNAVGSSDAVTADKSHSYGHEQTNIVDVWNSYHTKGEGSTVAVLDSGVATDHPDIDLEKWKDFTSHQSDEPVAYDEHGTLVSAIATGGDASGSYIGVAPEASLMHGAVVSDCSDGVCSTSESAVLAGIQWAVDNDADAVSISLGWYEYSAAFIDGVGNAHDAGTVVVGASGNDGEGSSLTPGNVYDTLSVGATDRSEEIASFSSSEWIDTREAWGSNAPDHWPEEYGVPHVVAPGVSIETATADGDYRTASGTSMATPHVAGSVALMQSATADDLEADATIDAIRETAWKPEEKGTDERYGDGIVDVYAALEMIGMHATVDGTVTDEATGDPLSHATVELAAADGTHVETTTGADGTYEFAGLPGESEYTVTVERDGYERTSENRHVPSEKTVSVDVALTGDGSIELEVIDEQFGDGVETATVEAVGEQGTYTATHTDDGSYVVSDVPSLGEYTLEIVADGYENEETIVPVETAGPVTASVVVTGDATLEITAENEDGNPVENATVTIVRGSGATFEPAVTTDGNGELAATVAGTGERYSVEVSQPEAGTGADETSPVESESIVAVTVTVTDSVLPTPGFGVGVAAVATILALGLGLRRTDVSHEERE